MTTVTPLSLQQAKIWLLFLRSANFLRLSLNITREICLYIGLLQSLPCINNSSIVLYDIHTGQFTTGTLKASYGANYMYCLLKEDRLLAVNLERTVEISLIDYEEEGESKLNIGRLWPGMIKIGPFAYVFGGNTSPAITSCEKYPVKTKNWIKISDMNGPKSCFTPCQVRNEVYLCCFNPDSKPFEAFNPVTEAFRELPVAYTSSLHGSVTFLIENTLYIVAYEKILLKWQLSKPSLDPVIAIALGSSQNNASSNIPPVRRGKQVYWVCYYDGSLVQFDLNEQSVRVMECNTPGNTGRAWN